MAYQYQKRVKMSMEAFGETIAIDKKNGIVHVLFRCKDQIHSECGMNVQVSLDEYGETYLGEIRYLTK